MQPSKYVSSSSNPLDVHLRQMEEFYRSTNNIHLARYLQNLNARRLKVPRQLITTSIEESAGLVDNDVQSAGSMVIVDGYRCRVIPGGQDGRNVNVEMLDFSIATPMQRKHRIVPLGKVKYFLNAIAYRGNFGSGAGGAGAGSGTQINYISTAIPNTPPPTVAEELLPLNYVDKPEADEDLPAGVFVAYFSHVNDRFGWFRGIILDDGSIELIIKDVRGNSVTVPFVANLTRLLDETHCQTSACRNAYRLLNVRQALKFEGSVFDQLHQILKYTRAEDLEDSAKIMSIVKNAVSHAKHISVDDQMYLVEALEELKDLVEIDDIDDSIYDVNNIIADTLRDSLKRNVEILSDTPYDDKTREVVRSMLSKISMLPRTQLDKLKSDVSAARSMLHSIEKKERDIAKAERDAEEQEKREKREYEERLQREKREYEERLQRDKAARSAADKKRRSRWAEEVKEDKYVDGRFDRQGDHMATFNGISTINGTKYILLEDFHKDFVDPKKTRTLTRHKLSDIKHSDISVYEDDEWRPEAFTLDALIVGWSVLISSVDKLEDDEDDEDDEAIIPQTVKSVKALPNGDFIVQFDDDDSVNWSSIEHAWGPDGDIIYLPLGIEGTTITYI